MKIRQGFVSNSSSSSFLIYGINLSLKEVANKIINFDDYFSHVHSCWEKQEEVNKKFSWKSEPEPTPSSVLKKENYVYSYIQNHGLDCYDPYGNIYIGLSWDKVKDDETGKQFKERVEKQIIELLGNNLDFSTYEHAWYDG